MAHTLIVDFFSFSIIQKTQHERLLGLIQAFASVVTLDTRGEGPCWGTVWCLQHVGLAQVPNTTIPAKHMSSPYLSKKINFGQSHHSNI